MNKKNTTTRMAAADGRHVFTGRAIHELSCFVDRLEIEHRFSKYLDAKFTAQLVEHMRRAKAAALSDKE